MARTRVVAGSTTKELTLPDLEQTLRAITPGMTYQQLLAVACAAGNNDAGHPPGPIPAHPRRCHPPRPLPLVGRVGRLHRPSAEGDVLPLGFRRRTPSPVHLRAGGGRKRPVAGGGTQRQRERGHPTAVLFPGTASTAAQNPDEHGGACSKPATSTVRGRRRCFIWIWPTAGWRRRCGCWPRLKDDPAIRTAMVSSPGQYLAAIGWHGLANATRAELVGATPVEQDDPLEDELFPHQPRAR